MLSAKKRSIRNSLTGSVRAEQWKKSMLPFIPYLITFVVMWILYLHFYSKELINNGAAVCLWMRTVLFVIVLYGAYLAYERKLTIDKIIMLCIIGGLVMRIGYAFYTPYNVREHDLGPVSVDEFGHAAYICNFYENNSLPDSYYWQFYHPPFFHFLASLFMKFFGWLHKEADLHTVFEVSKLVSCFASCSVVLMVRSLCRELKCKPEMTCIIVAIMAFQPNFYLLAGRVNNDSTAAALLVFSFLMLVKWYHSRKFSHLIALAAGIGFGMMAKLNAGIIAFVAGPVMLYVFWQAVRDKKWKGLIAQYGAFLAVCAPLGLWYSIRNYVLFKMPFGYVLNIDENGINELLYRGHLSFAKRFLSIPWGEFQSVIYCDPTKDYNVPTYLLRCSLFGEFQFENVDVVALLLLYTNIILVLLSAAATVAVIWKGKKFTPMLRYGCGLFWLAIMASYVVFNIKYPDSCTMDFRYIAPAVISSTVYLAAFWQMLREYVAERNISVKQLSEVHSKQAKYIAVKFLVWFIPVCCALFVLFSAYMYSSLS